MEDPMIVTRDVAVPLREITVRTSRSSGPGGQHANVTASRIEARFEVFASTSLTDEQKRQIAARLGPVVTAVAQDTRSQLRNRELAVERLAGRLGSALRRRRPRRTTKPTRAAKERRLDAKRQTARRKSERRKPRQGDCD
jgi:ribosome-associated protein